MKRRGSFTLIELLVVLGIIVLLALMIAAAVARAKQRGRTVACLNNLRQLGLAVHIYVSDAHGRMPSLQNRASTNELLPAIDTVLLPGSGHGAFRCPADDKNLFEASGTSYFWNITVNGQDITQLFSVLGGSDLTQIPLLCDKEGFHPGALDRVNTLYADSHVDKQLKFSTSLP